ncbi:hypothetical protein K435DRAFT_782527 [Dendrothele bispora CBS 962.96]|uniref:Uncharacterized protein n=1 Tax=Dendrothele bispora (strain CBS 962.96) TaxID=1314807 RepID=A0A4S8LE83_DENBC|nr:hypothetical protein K435DRAFT_782527 [Dendrothele bispora CBS 962.96]
MHEAPFVDLDPLDPTVPYITPSDFEHFPPSSDTVDPSMAIKLPISPSNPPHVPSPSSVYSLHAALDSSVISTNSQPPVPILFPAPTAVNPALKQEEAAALTIGSTILDERVVQSASTAAVLCRSDKGAEASRIVDDLREKLAYVSDVISGMKDMSVNESPTPGLRMTPPNHISPPVVTPESVQQAYPASIDMQSSLPTPPDSRKRCLSDFDEQRPLKSLKAEPQDDVPLSSNDMYAPILPKVPTFHDLQSLQSASSLQSSTNSFVFNPVKQYPGSYPETPSPESIGKGTPPPFPPFRSAWSESVVPTRHSHSLSAGSITVSPSRSSSDPNFAAKLPPAVPGVNGRMARSGSIGGTFTHPFTFPYTQPFVEVPVWPGSRTEPEVTPLSTPSLTSSSQWTPTSSAPSSSVSQASWDAPVTTQSHTSPEDEGDDGDDYDEDESSGSGNYPTSSATSDVPQEYRAEVDRVFFEYLNKICSNLEATDAKGEAIHQTLMPKKMQRLDESPDFRPFKFRIQAFTNAFLEELARQGYPEEKIPMKKIRHYLWRQPYIQRFNEDGRKAKTKGNHVWNIEAKKIGDGKWEFRPFHRKLAGTPPAVAYCGLRWHWTPRVWDPQASFQGVPVHLSSPSLPSWLSWNGDELSGVPPPDAESCDVTIIAKFMLGGQEGQVSQSFRINIAPRSAVDGSFNNTRSSTTNESPRRISDMFRPPPPPPANTSENTPARVVEVLQSVALRVTEAAHIQQMSTRLADDISTLVKQKQVVEQSLVAYDQALTGPTPPETHRLAVAAQAVVAEAAQSAVAPRAAAAGITPTPLLAIQVASVGEMTDLAQEALAEAVKMQGVGSKDVDVIETTSSLLASRHPRPHETAIPQVPNVVPGQLHLSGAGSRAIPICNTYSVPVTNFV